MSLEEVDVGLVSWESKDGKPSIENQIRSYIGFGKRKEMSFRIEEPVGSSRTYVGVVAYDFFESHNTWKGIGIGLIAGSLIGYFMNR